MSSLRVCSLLLGAGLIGGCVDHPSYYYAPESATVTRAGVAVRVENIPQEAPQGTVEISSTGIQEIRNGQRALHVRMAVDNEGSDTPWTVDIREQVIEVPNAGRAAPLSARADLQTLPAITIGRRDKRTLDLYYPLPPGVREADDLAAFDLLWNVKTAQRDVSGRTRIDRLEAQEEVQPTTMIYGGWGPYWWYDPWYPHVVYRSVYVSPHGGFHGHRR